MLFHIFVQRRIIEDKSRKESQTGQHVMTLLRHEKYETTQDTRREVYHQSVSLSMNSVEVTVTSLPRGGYRRIYYWLQS
jgi:hypothetical protein